MTSRLDWKSAGLDVQKLRAYCLNPDHPRGRDKARVFLSALGVGIADADWLRAEILRRLPEAEAIPSKVDEFGARYHVDVPLMRLGRRAVVRTAWIVASKDQVPRFVSCWVL